MKTPAKAAFETWVKLNPSASKFLQLGEWDEENKAIWTAIADAVIAQSKTIIAEEMAKALMRGDDTERMNALMWYAGNRSSEQRIADDGKRAAKAIRAIITQATAST